MNKNLFYSYRDKILSLIKLLGEKGCLNITETKIETHHPQNLTKPNTVIQLDKIKKL